MRARGLLMIEHRLIERMVAQMKDALVQIRSTGKIDPQFVDEAVDFASTYADRTHHGKEEEILFRDLDKRPLSTDDRRLMERLLRDHALGRRTTKALAEANTSHRGGDVTAWERIADALQTLVDLYPQHIEQEDKVFFPAARAYFTDDEDRAMLQEFWAFDRTMIHAKYKGVVEEIEARHSGRGGLGGR